LVARAGPLPVLWDAAAAGAGSFALDTESRETSPPDDAWLGGLRAADLAFKKIDSLLRGRTVAEIAACLERGGFASAVIAPAFPAQQRITCGGRQYWRPAPDVAWRPVEVDLLGELRTRVQVRAVAAAGEIVGHGFFLCDAASEVELDAIVRAGHALAPPRLWVGTAGLARSLAGPRPAPDMTALPAPLLIVVGSHHPVTLAQVGRLAALAPAAVAAIGSDGQVEAALAIVAGALATAGRAALVLALPDGTGAEVAGPLFDRALALAADRLVPPGALVVTGGATLFRLVRAFDATALTVTGELLPGIARSRLEGGRFAGATVVSKSGAFGAPDVLVRCWQLAATGARA
jgi:uncharacterized protein YgbK (DUF1537 family)